MGGDHVAYLGAFTAGLLTFLSPCIFPLIPSFIAYIAGVSYSELTGSQKEVRMKTVSHTIFFILGFSAVFTLLGLTATAIGQALFAYQKIIRIVGGVLLIVFGIILTGVLKLAFLEKSAHMQFRAKRASYFGSFLVGVTFAAAWTPCAGPLLGSILVIAGTEGSALEGMKLLALYSAGIGVPFLITALAMQQVLSYLNKFKKVMVIINKAAGVILIIVGILIATDSMNVIAQFLLNLVEK